MAASLSCHPLQLQVDSSDLNPHLIIVSLTHKLEPQTASRSLWAFFAQLTGAQNIDKQTTLRATSIAIG